MSYNVKSNLKKIYQIHLKTGLEIELHSHGIARSDNLYLFLYKQCFAEIPVMLIADIKVLSASTMEETLEMDEPGVPDSPQSKFSVRLSEEHFCLVICSDIKCAGDNIHFFCGQTIFMTLIDGKKYGVKIYR